jgi:ferredoxin
MRGTWVVSHKPVAVAAGLGHMGIHRNVIHPKFGNFIVLGTVLIDADTTEHDAPLDFNPCLECKLCVAACPVGAIAPDGGFNFSACFMHNYREFMGGFTDWIEQVADSKDAMDYRRRISEPETASMWQSLSHGADYKSAYCMAVCPAGEDVIGPYLEDRKRHLQEVVKPLQEKSEKGEPWTGLTGRIDKSILGHAMTGFDVQRVHLCGPPAMMDAVRAALIEFGVPEEHIRTEAFGTAKRIPTIRAAKGAKLAGRVIFQRSQVTAAAPKGVTLLDVADTNELHR